jgi:hypothetical protein
MYAYGFHLRTRSAELHLKSADSRVAATFQRSYRNSQQDRNFVMASLEYVGNVDEILELDYGTVYVIVLVYTWVKANYRGPFATIKKDRWGFNVANFESLIQLGYESFAFPISMEQVFYSSCPDMPGWKVIIRTEVRGCKVVANPEEAVECPIFQAGRDADHVGLRVPEEILEAPELPLPNSRVVCRKDLFEEIVQENNEAFDRNVGESSEEE